MIEQSRESALRAIESADAELSLPLSNSWLTKLKFLDRAALERGFAKTFQGGFSIGAICAVDVKLRLAV